MLPSGSPFFFFEKKYLFSDFSGFCFLFLFSFVFFFTRVLIILFFSKKKNAARFLATFLEKMFLSRLGRRVYSLEASFSFFSFSF